MVRKIVFRFVSFGYECVHHNRRILWVRELCYEGMCGIFLGDTMDLMCFYSNGVAD